MKRLVIIAAVLLALVVTASAIIEATGEATSPKAPTATLSGTPLPGVAQDVERRPKSEVSGATPDSGVGGVPTQAQARTAVLGAMVAAEIGSVLLGGKASWMPAKYGPDYLAMRIPKGTQVRICAATCWDAVVNDYGPSKRIHPDRIADIAVERWEAITGLDRSAGVARVTVEYGGGPEPTLPPTHSEGDE